MSIVMSTNGLKYVVPEYAAWIRSFPYVRGEKYTRNCPYEGIDSRGMKIPEMKISGSRTTLSIDMMSPGLSVGYEAKRVPIVAKQKEVSRTPIMSGIALRTGVPKITIPAMNGTTAMPMLYKKPLMLSPRTTACSETGAEMSRSNVFILRSIGIETGSMDDAEKRIVIAMRPGIMTEGSPGLPTANARNMKRGKSMPETMIFGLR